MTSSHQSNYRAEIDGLRAFAVLSVVAFHAFPSAVVGGFTGVDVFFVISGFLITSHIFEKLDEGRFSLVDFFQRRIRRIFPALIVVMGVSLLFGWFVLLSDEFSMLGKHVASGAAFISNFVFAAEVGYFDPAAELKPMLHLWSLGVEEQFYILWPLTLWLAWKLNFNLFLLTLLVLVLSFLVNIAWATTYPTQTFFWPFGRFWELLCGSLLGWFSVTKHKFLVPRQGGKAWPENAFSDRVAALLQSQAALNLASILGLSFLLAGVVIIDSDAPFPSYWALLPVVGALLIIHSGSRTWFNRFFLTNRVAVFFGLISYPLYLWHWPILSFLHIIEDGTPHRDARLGGVVLAILLAWITYKFVEKPIRFGNLKEPMRALCLSGVMVFIGLAGWLISRSNFDATNTVETVYLRGGLEHRIGSSSRWYEGKDDWLYLGNDSGRVVEKLKLASKPTQSAIDAERSTFLRISEAAAQTGTKVALLVGPNKPSIYPEYLPPQLKPSETRYFDFFADALAGIPNVSVHDPREDLLRLKDQEGLLYYRTDTHWNSKGALLSLKGLLEKLGIPAPKVTFSEGPARRGDLIKISGLEDFPLRPGDNWDFTFDRDFKLERQAITGVPESDAFGAQDVLFNSNPLSDKRVWIIGDSFTQAQRPFLNATFAEVHYIGPWTDLLQDLPEMLVDADKKPDLIIVIRVERSF